MPQPIDQALTFLLEHLPPQMHLVITTREDPQLPLARLRARGQLTELRAADLRFTPAEAAEFLNQVMGLSLCGGRDRRAGRPHRRLDCRPAAGRALHAGAARMSRVHPGVRRQTTATSWTIWSKRSCSVSPNASAASCSRPPFSTGLNGPLCDAVTGQDGRQRAVGGPGARQLLCRAAGRQAPLVSLPPPLCRRALRAFDGGAARSGSHAASARE